MFAVEVAPEHTLTVAAGLVAARTAAGATLPAMAVQLAARSG